MLCVGILLLKKPAMASHPTQSRVQCFHCGLTFTMSLISPSTTLPLSHSVPRTTYLFATYGPNSWPLHLLF